MRRLGSQLLLTATLLGGVAYGQTPPVLTSTEIVGAIDLDKIIANQGQNILLDGGAIEVQVDAAIFKQKTLLDYEAEYTGACSVYMAGVFGCGDISYSREVSYNHIMRTAISYGCSTSHPNYSNSGFHHKGNNVYNNTPCDSNTQGTIDWISNRQTYGVSWAQNWYISREYEADKNYCSQQKGVTCDANAEGWHQFLRGAMLFGLDSKQPSVAELQASYGVMLIGHFVDGGYGDGFEDDGDGPGTGGDGGNVDPGNCEDGWILTRAVCVIRDQGDRLWSFLSHDAWVPSVTWSSRIQAVRSNASSRVPFGYFDGVLSWETDGGFGGPAGMQAPCVFGGRADGEGGRYNDSNFKFTSDTGVWGHGISVPGMCLDDIAGFVWWHEHGRHWIWILALTAVPLSIINRFLK